MTIQNAASRKQSEQDVDAFITGNAQGTPDTPAPSGAINEGDDTAGTPGAPTQAAPAPEQSATTPTPEDATWEQRFRVLQGKFNSEVPRLTQEVKDLRSQLANAQAGGDADPAEVNRLRQEVADLRTQLAGTSRSEGQPPGPASVDNIQGIEELRAEYGSDLIDGLVGVIQQQVKNSIDPVAQRVDTVADSMEQSTFQQFAGAVRTVLQPAGIDYDEYNNDPLFIDWLKLPVSELSDVTRQAALNEAVSKRDVHRAAAFFQAYAQSGHVGGTQNPVGNTMQQHVEIGGDAAPGTLPAGEEQGRWNPDEYQAMAARLRRREITQAEFDEYERKHWPR